MDFRFSPEEEAFRAKAREFFHRELPPGWVGLALWEEEPEWYWEFEREFVRKLGRRDWKL